MFPDELLDRTGERERHFAECVVAFKWRQAAGATDENVLPQPPVEAHVLYPLLHRSLVEAVEHSSRFVVKH